MGTVLVWTYLAVSHFVTERAVHAARSVLTTTVHRRERAGAVTAEKQRLHYPKVLAPLIAHALVLLAPLMKILHVHAAKQWNRLSPVQTMDAPKSGMCWGLVLMCPMQTGQKWMLAST